MPRTNQLQEWETDFGREYTQRNIISSETRLNAFQTMIGGLTISNVLEVGCNRGHNLVTISQIGDCQLVGLEPNKFAADEAKKYCRNLHIVQGNCFEIPFPDSSFDLVFTAGVLIHLSLVDLPMAIAELSRVCRKYLLIIEYYAEAETPIRYRGCDNLLWKRDFRRHVAELVPTAHCIKEGFWGKDKGFDNCNWWVFWLPGSL